MARTDAVIVVQTRHIALRTLLAVMLAVTLALSMIVPSGGAPAAADEASVGDGPFDGLGDLIEVESVEFVAQPVDAVLDDSEGCPTDTYCVTATGSTPTTVSWSYTRTHTYTAVTASATVETRDLAIAALNAELIEFASETFGTTKFATTSSQTIATEFASATTASITTESVATQLDIAIGQAIQVATPSLVAWDIATTPTALTTTPTALTTTPTASTSVDTATATTPTVTTSFYPLQVQGPETRRRVELAFDVPEALSLSPTGTFTVTTALSLATRSVGTEEPSDIEIYVSEGGFPFPSVDVQLSRTRIFNSTDLSATVSSIEEPAATSEVFGLWEASGACGDDESCSAEISGDVPNSHDAVRVTARGADDGSGTGTLLLGWLGDREFPGGDSSMWCGETPYQGLPGTILFDVVGGFFGEKLVTVQVPRSIVQLDTNNGRAQYDVCFLDEAGLLAFDEDGTPGELLPTCGERLGEGWQRATAPCIESRTAVRSVGSLPAEWRSTLRGGLEIVIRLPAEDPMFR